MSSWKILPLLILLGAGSLEAQGGECSSFLILSDTMSCPLIIKVKEASYVQFDRQGILQGKKTTGLVSLDSLNQREGLLAIKPYSTNENDPALYTKLVYFLYFPAQVDLVRLAQVYAKNEHIDWAEEEDTSGGPLGGEESVVQPVSWSNIKLLRFHLEK